MQARHWLSAALLFVAPAIASAQSGWPGSGFLGGAGAAPPPNAGYYAPADAGGGFPAGGYSGQMPMYYPGGMPAGGAMADPNLSYMAGQPPYAAEGVDPGATLVSDDGQMYADGAYSTDGYEAPVVPPHRPVFTWQPPPGGSCLLNYIPQPYAGLSAQDGGTAGLFGSMVRSRLGQFYLRADALMLRRTNPEAGHPLIQSLAPTAPIGTVPTTVLDSGQLQFKNEVGQRVTLGLATSERSAFEVTWWSLYNWVATSGVTGAPGSASLQLPGTLGIGSFGGANAFVGADSIIVDYSTRLYNVEANYLATTVFEKFSILAGARTLQLYDRMFLQSSSLLFGNGIYDLPISNQLYGGQLGFLFKQNFDLFTFEVGSKSGIYANHVHMNNYVADAVNGVFPGRNISVSENNSAFVQEFSLNGVYNITSAWAFRLGYQVLWIDSVALAPNNADFSLGGGTTIHHGGSLFIYGGNFGVEARF